MNTNSKLVNRTCNLGRTFILTFGYFRLKFVNILFVEVIVSMGIHILVGGWWSVG